MPENAPMFRNKWDRRHPKKQHNWNHKKSTTQRGYGHQWRKLRDSVMRRDQGLCQVCLAIGKYTPADEVDHVTPKAAGGSEEPDNLQAICKPCHAEKTAKESNAGCL